MKVYRIEYLTKGYNYETREYEQRWEGIFGSSYVTYPSDAQYQTYGCTLWEHKNDEWRFACRTMEKLVEYFGSDFAHILNQKGVRVVEYEVKRQHCIFSKKRIELVFRARQVIKERVIICTKQSETLQSTGKIGQVNRTSAIANWDNGTTLSSQWLISPMEAEIYNKNLKRMEYFNELFKTNNIRGL